MSELTHDDPLHAEECTGVVATAGRALWKEASALVLQKESRSRGTEPSGNGDA